MPIETCEPTSNMVLRFEAVASPTSYDSTTRSGKAVLMSDAVVQGVRIDFASFFAPGMPDRLALQLDHDNRLAEKRGEFTGFEIEQHEDGSQILVASFTLSRRADNEPLHTMLVEGLVSGVSIGCLVSRWGSETDQEGGSVIRIAEQGRLLEASFVNNPADPRATLRSLETMPETRIIDDHTVDTPGQGDSPARMEPAQFDNLMRMVGASDELRETLGASDLPDRDRLQLVMRSLEHTAPPVSTVRSPQPVTLDDPNILRSAVIDFYDAVNRGEDPTGPARDVFANGERGLAERLCRSNGIQTVGLSDAELVRRAATTSDFPIIAGATFNLAMRREMEAVAAPITGLFGRDTVSTFNPEDRGQVDWTSLAIGDRKEGGEYQHSYISETGEKIQVAVIGGITSKSYELTANAGARLGNDGVQFGRRLAAEVADRKVAFVEQGSHAGPEMSDGAKVFAAGRGNIADFAVDGSTEIAQLMALRSAMARRKGAGDVMIGQYPTFWLVHSDFEETALRLLASVQASAIADVNPLAGKLQVVVEPRLSDPAKSWLVADPSRMDGAVRVYLQGQEAPFTDSRIKFETDAVQFKIRHPFGIGWREWRSWTRLDHVSP